MKIRNNIVYGLTLYLNILPALDLHYRPAGLDFELLLWISGICDTVKNCHPNTQGILAVSVWLICCIDCNLEYVLWFMDLELLQNSEKPSFPTAHTKI
jgi:hypothetical protein